MCRRSTPSRTAPRRAIASCERTLRPSVFSATRTLEAVLQEEVLRFGIRRRAPELAVEERRPDLDLAVGRPHVEQARGPDRATCHVPYLGVDDRLPPRHQLLRLAHQPQRVIDRRRRLPREIAADVLVAHGLEEARGVTLVDRF